MKKLLLSALAVCAISTASAQITTNAGTFNKPTAGSIIMEVNFSPDLTGGAGMFSLPTISSNSETVGLKARKFVSDTKAYRAAANISVTNDNDGTDSTTDFLVGLGFGIEKHFTGAERLSTYWGYGAHVGYDHKQLDPDTDDDTIGLGANVFTGFDYYVMPNIYLGAEVSYGAAFTSQTVGEGDAVTNVSLAPGITPTLRLGWKL